MKTNKTIFAGAALAGIFSISLAAKAGAATPDNTPRKISNAFDAGHPAADEKGEKDKNSCKGKNGCPAKK